MVNAVDKCYVHSDYFTNQLTLNIAMGADVSDELDAFDAEWAIARAAVEDAG